eukprot:gene8599-424_t
MSKFSVLSVVFFFFLVTLALSEETLETMKKNWNVRCLKIYGNYCGPGWCGSKFYGEACKKPRDPITNCNTNIRPRDGLDSCCQRHDSCCINARRAAGYPRNSLAIQM